MKKLISHIGRKTKNMRFLNQNDLELGLNKEEQLSPAEVWELFTQHIKENLSELSTNTEKSIDIFPGAKNEYWEAAGEESFKKFTNEKGVAGEYTKEEIKNRTYEEILPDGNPIKNFRDAGVCFYQVKYGDTINGIKKKVQQIDEFQYLKAGIYDTKGNARNIFGFNIEGKDLKAGIDIPIPLEWSKRQIDYKEFTNYAHQAILEMETDPIYGTAIKELLEKYGEKRLIEIMMAFARSESAGEEIINGKFKPIEKFEKSIGNLSYHRWEEKGKKNDNKNTYSLSMFHILMDEFGTNLRHNLGLTKGQLYHPKNASKLFLAFWLEKKAKTSDGYDTERLNKYFRFESKKDFARSARVYSGGQKGYAKKLGLQFQYAQLKLKDVAIPPVPKQEIFATNTADPKKPEKEVVDNTPPVTPVPQITETKKPETETVSETGEPFEVTESVFYTVEMSKGSLFGALKNANWSLKDRPLKTNDDLRLAKDTVWLYIKKYFNEKGTYYPEDSLCIGQDEKGVYCILKQKGKVSDKIRIELPRERT